MREQMEMALNTIEDAIKDASSWWAGVEN